MDIYLYTKIAHGCQCGEMILKSHGGFQSDWFSMAVLELGHFKASC